MKDAVVNPLRVAQSRDAAGCGKACLQYVCVVQRVSILAWNTEPWGFREPLVMAPTAFITNGGEFAV